MIRLIIAEDHDILRDGLKSILTEDTGIKVVGEASNGKQLIDLLEMTPVDVILMDINMPVMNGVEATKHIHQYYKNIKVIALSMLDHPNYLQQMTEAGASGYILKKTGKNDLIFAIKQVLKGERYISPEISERLESNPVLPAKKVHFTKREMQILEMLAEGMTNKEIAEKIFLSKRTVETHRKNLIDKTGSKNTSALIKYAICQGILKDQLM